MALTEETVIDKIEVLENGAVQVRHVTRVLKDGETIAQNYHRCVLPADQLTTEVAAFKTAVEAVCP